MLLRIFSLLALGMSLNIATASETIDGTIATGYQGQQPLLLAERYTSRRRGIECQGTPPSDATDWTLNICEYVQFCYVDPQDIKLWLPDNKLPVTGKAKVVIKKSGSSEIQATGRWGKGKTWNWPEGASIETGTTYLITLRKGPQYFLRDADIVLHKMPDSFSSELEKADWINENCSEPQVDQLVNEQQA